MHNESHSLADATPICVHDSFCLEDLFCFDILLLCHACTAMVLVVVALEQE
jgi:hypothetical protein